MGTFVIIPTWQSTEQKSALKNAIVSNFDTKSYELPEGEFLVSYDGTSKQLSDLLDISDGKLGSALVLSFSGYWGRSSKDLWEWLDVNQK